MMDMTHEDHADVLFLAADQTRWATKKRNEAIVAAHQAGLPIAAIARHSSLSRAGVRYIIDQANNDG